MDYYRQYQQCMKQNQPMQALQHLQQHLNAHRLHAYGFYQAGHLLRDLEQWPQALCAFGEACRLDPEQSEFHARLGITYHQMQRPELAIQSYNSSHEKNREPEILFKRGMALLMAGRYQEGWQDYEWRIHSSVISEKFKWHPTERLWKGQPFPGQTLVVYTEQGLGDDLQFCRYLPYVKALGGKVVFATSPSLLPIMATLSGVDHIVEHVQSTYESLEFHWAVPLMSLPHLCGTTLDSIPSQMPYLAVPPDCREKWLELMNPYLTAPSIRKIGLVYACNPDNYGQVRSIPFPLWHPLFSLPGLQWFSVQKGEAATAVQQFAANRTNLIDLSHHIRDFGDTAALLDQLDLLISVDTSVPHLAGALNKPVWLLLPFVVDWRWMLRRSDSPWYPSFRLFRQPAPSQWNPVMDQVAAALSTLR